MLTRATRQFQESWDSRLRGEHWTRVKALTRRLGNLGEDEYDTLKPLADLIRLLSEQIMASIAAPREWKPVQSLEEERRTASDQVAREFFSRLHDMVKSRLWINRKREWESAYDLRGPGSGNLRKRDVGTIYSAAAPVSDVAPMPIASEFLDEARSRFKEAALAAGAEVL